MALVPEIKSIISPNLEYGSVPAEPDNCSVFVETEIGIKGKEGADIFSFTAVTPKFLASNPDTRWGRGHLIVSEFSWNLVESMLGRLLMHAHRDTWSEVAGELSKELNWEFENYQEYKQ
jgi:hypothetical protein